ncbi:hypothetical protein [Albibacterium profundi]|uniref:HEAT repeat domain-containing protein n=1 Tax=Albibacterium profundi TaxID=3134906 RepID=A0ABV5CGP3_9SPHI
MSKEETKALKQRLSSRIHMTDIRSIIHYVQGSDERKQELYALLFDTDEKVVAYYAGWVMSHFPKKENEWLFDKQDELIDLAMDCRYDGLRRQVLTILYRQPMRRSERVDFLDFCMEAMFSSRQPLAVQSLGIKIAYEICRLIPELNQELKAALDLVDEEELSPAIRAAKRNVLKAMKTGKSLQNF